MKDEFKAYDIDVSSLGFLIDRLLYAMVKRRNQDLDEKEWDIQHPEFIVMKVLNLKPNISQSQLAKVMGRERSGISKIIASLEKKGYVERTALNGSTNLVKLTEKGIGMMPGINELSEKLNERAFKGFSQKNRAAMIRNLERLYNNVISDEK